MPSSKLQTVATHTEQRPNATLTYTPGGPRPRTHVHVVQAGQVAKVKTGATVPRQRPRFQSEAQGPLSRAVTANAVISEQGCPESLPNWITYATLWNKSGGPVQKFTTRWIVPADPTTRGDQLIYFFSGMETADGSHILQPVLQWGNSGLDSDGVNHTGRFWTATSWLVGDSQGDAVYKLHTQVRSGDQLTGTIVLLSQNAAGFVYSCEFEEIAGSRFETEPIPELLWCVETLEAYELNSGLCSPYDLFDASEYPASGSVGFTDIYIATANAIPNGQWSTVDKVTNYGEQTTIIDNSATAGQIRCSF